MAALLATAAGTAYAVENLPPEQPLVKDLQSGGKACATGDDTPYVAAPPRLSAVLYDPEEDNQPSEFSPVSGEFEAWWTNAAGVEQRRAYTTITLGSGSRQYWTMPNDIPANTVVSWHVRTNDGQAASAWSDEGDGSVCSFVYDDVNPEKATITSPEYPEPKDVYWVDGVGVYGHFTMDSPSDDVVSYTYGFLGGPYGTVSAERPGAAVTIAYLPLSSGPTSLTVRAIDRSGRSSGESHYDFNVKAGRAPVARWKLDDPAGSRSAAAETGSAARAGTGVTFGGPAPAGTTNTATVGLDGSGHAFLTPDAPATDTRKTFAVSAWVRPAETDRNMTVASQDADGVPGFSLGLRRRGLRARLVVRDRRRTGVRRHPRDRRVDPSAGAVRRRDRKGAAVRQQPGDRDRDRRDSRPGGRRFPDRARPRGSAIGTGGTGTSVTCRFTTGSWCRTRWPHWHTASRSCSATGPWRTRRTG